MKAFFTNFDGWSEYFDSPYKLIFVLQPLFYRYIARSATKVLPTLTFICYFNLLTYIFGASRSSQFSLSFSTVKYL